MKKVVHIVTICCILMFITSCDKEESNWNRPTDISGFVPNECISLSGSSGVNNNSAYFNYKVSFLGDFDFWQLHVNSVEYYFDGILIDHQEISPYEVKFHPRYLNKGKHLFTIRANILDMYSNKRFSIEKIKEIEIFSDGFPTNSLLSSHSITISGNNVNFNINEVVLSYLLKSDNWTIKSVSYYLDKEFIGKSINSPYAFTHFAKLQQGTHQLRLCADIYNSVTQNNNIVEENIEFEVK